MCVCSIVYSCVQGMDRGGVCVCVCLSAVTLEKEMDEILWREEEGSGSGKEQLRSF